MDATLPEPIDFTARALSRIVCPSSGKADKSGRLWVNDPDVPGLRLMVTESGVRNFYWARRVAGRYEQIKIGPLKQAGDVDGFTVEAARRRAAELNSMRAEGKNLRDDLRAARAELTLAAAWESFLTWGKVHKKSWSMDEWNYNRFLSPWKTRRLSGIAHKDVVTLHTRIGRDNGKYGANRVLALLSSIYGHAEAKENPCRGVTKFEEFKRDRFLQADEIPRFFAALDAEPNETMRDFFWMCLLTGARRSNVAAMAWADIVIERGTWTIPETKAGGSHVVVLPPKAVAILTAAQETRMKACPWVFPSHGASGHITEIKSAWKRILTAANISNLRPHDLRRSLGSWMAAAGASLPIIGKSLGHRQQSTTQIYARLNMDPVRASVNLAVNAMMAAAEAKPENAADDKGK